jgi:hypothetical protein
MPDDLEKSVEEKIAAPAAPRPAAAPGVVVPIRAQERPSSSSSSAKPGGTGSTDPNGGKSSSAGGTGSSGGGGTGSSGGGGGSSGSGGSDSSGSSGSAINAFFSALGASLVKAGVFATRNFVLPVASSYARGPEKEELKDGTFTVAEPETLRRAGQKLVCEVGSILVANYPIMPSGTPSCMKDDRGQYPEASVAYVLSGVKAAQTYLATRAAAKAVEQQQQQQQQLTAAQAQAQAQRAPVAVSSLKRVQK